MRSKRGPERGRGGRRTSCGLLALLLAVAGGAGGADAFAAQSAEGLGFGDRALREGVEFFEALENGDPLERINRATYAFNLLVEAYALDPFYRFYQRRIPPPVQLGLYNAFQNLQEPIVAVNSGLEGDLENAGVAGLRFAINSTAGLLGVMDVARHFDLTSRKTDLSATLCRYSVPGGPYLVLPVLGPSSARDLTGRVITNLTIYGFVGSWFYPYYSGKLLTEYVDDRPGLDRAMAGAVDPYVRNRAIFRQREAHLCREEPPESADYRLLGAAEEGAVDAATE